MLPHLIIKASEFPLWLLSMDFTENSLYMPVEKWILRILQGIMSKIFDARSLNVFAAFPIE